ncbi:MAG TPA: MarC family protein [Spirochaetales bacterium]|nr:MarC family protein [Spirochaetales bacterium]HRY53525.1 MarC family protein [Spirochaetia bacterium]HRZ63791.1 MarC family protein [Spirochaetia bacterium]
MEQTFLSATILLIVITDPLGNTPLFISALKRVAPERRLKVISRECAIAFAVLLVFLLFGRQILGVLHLREETLKVAGGVILLLIAINMIFPGSGASMGGEGGEGEPFIVPVAIPLISGPSAMVTAILIGASDPSRMLEWIGALAITMLVTFVVFLGSTRLEKVLGRHAIAAIERLMGLVLTAVAVDMLLTGVASYIGRL